MTIYDQIQSAAKTIFDTYKSQTADGKISFQEALTLTYNATATFVHLVEGLGQNLGADKKEAVLAVVGQFYDTVIRPLPLTGLPGPLEAVVDTALRSLIMSLVGAWIDSLVNIFSKLGWVKPESQGGPEKLTQLVIF